MLSFTRRWCSTPSVDFVKRIFAPLNFDAGESLNKLREVKGEIQDVKPSDVINYFREKVHMSDPQIANIISWMDRSKLLGTTENITQLHQLTTEPKAKYLTYQLLSRICAVHGSTQISLTYLQKILKEPSWDTKIRWKSFFSVIIKATGVNTSRFDNLKLIIDEAVKESNSDVVRQSVLMFVHQLALEKGYRIHKEHSDILNKYNITGINRYLITLTSLCSDPYTVSSSVMNEVSSTPVLKQFLSTNSNERDKLSRVINRSGIVSKESQKIIKYLKLLGDQSETKNSISPGSEYCLEYKHGTCTTGSCDKIHNLVKCPREWKCNDSLCPFVHPAEVAWKWAADVDLTSITEKNNKSVVSEGNRGKKKKRNPSRKSKRSSRSTNDLFFAIRSLKLPVKPVDRSKKDINDRRLFHNLVEDLSEVLLNNEDRRLRINLAVKHQASRCGAEALKLSERRPISVQKSPGQKLNEVLSYSSEPRKQSPPPLKIIEGAASSLSLLDVLKKPRSSSPPVGSPTTTTVQKSKRSNNKPDWFNELRDVVAHVKTD